MASTLTNSGAESSGTLPGTRRSEAAADGRELTTSGTLTQLTVGGLSTGRDPFGPAPGGDSGALCATPSAERRAPSAERRAPSAERRAPSAERRPNPRATPCRG